MKIYLQPKESKWAELVKRPVLDTANLTSTVGGIFDAVKTEGDIALVRYTLKFDGVSIDKLLLDQAAIKQLAAKTPPTIKQALDVAYSNIYRFHKAQIATDSPKIETMPGVICWQATRSIDSVGLYIPGGSAPLISTALMLGVPAQLAGNKKVVLCTPPDSNGQVNPAICYAASKCGIKQIYLVGGIQAIAAMTFGTKTIPKVDKIFGPGNQYVTAAKLAARDYGVAIDMPAGPSEVMVIADDSARADFVAADLLSQAEHGADSQAILLTTSQKLAKAINMELKKQLGDLPRREIAQEALANSFCAVFDSIEEAVAFANLYAPEHLIINAKNANALISKISNAGSVFIGQYTPEAAGDYASGPNHTLPTGGWARSYSGLSVKDFVKTISFQAISKQGLTKLSPAIVGLASAEGLSGHAKAIETRSRRVVN